MQNLQLQEFFVEGGKPRQSHVLLHITEPSTTEEMAKGNFFAVCEINNAEERDIAILQKIIEDAESEYYSLTETEDEHSLETVLKKINRERWGIPQGDGLHCAIGVIRGKEVAFSFHGEPQILVFYQNRDGQYLRINLTESNMETEGAEQPHLFSQLVQGKISANDFVLVSTPNVLRYFNSDRLQKIITSRPPRQSAEHLERVLSELRNSLSFGGIILHLTDTAPLPGKINPQNIIKKGGSERSLKNLFSTEKRTASTLAPTLFPGLNQRVKTALRGQDEDDQALSPAPPKTHTQINAAHSRPRQTQPTGNPPTNYATGLKQIIGYIIKGGRLLILGIWWVIAALAKLIVGAGHFLMTLFFVITNFQNRRQNTINDWKRIFNNYRAYLREMPRITKILLLAATATVLVFIVSIFYLNGLRAKKAQAEIFDQTITAVTVKKDNAESALVYGDDNAALVELAAAKEILKQTDCATKIQIQQCEALNTQMEQMLLRLRKMSEANTTILAEWPDTGVNRLFKIKNSLMLYSSSSPSLFIYDLLTKETRMIDTAVNGFNDASVPKENDFAVLLYKNSALIKYYPDDNAVKQIESGFTENAPNIKSIVVYNRRLYSVDADTEQIYRHDNIASGFGPGKEWAKSSQSALANAFDLTIDGDLYVSHENGEISKWINGAKQDFALQGLYPPLTSAGKLWTYNDVNNLYILDSTGKRLIIVDKNGKLSAQIENKNWGNPEGLTVEEINKRAFVADGGKLYQVNLP